MPNNILFAAGDPGGANAIRPVALWAARRQLPVAILDNGSLPDGLGDGFRVVSGDAPFDVLCFGTSLNDRLPLSLARTAKQRGKRVVAVLDNWVNYRSRLMIDGLPMFVPDVYAVMDDKARAEAVADGVPEACLTVTGHPNLAGLADAVIVATPEWRSDFREAMGLGLGGRGLVAFINEPVANDQGTNADNPAWRGYTERDALSALAQGLGDAAIDVAIVPHPRDDFDRVAALWEAVKGRCRGRAIRNISGRDAMLAADRTAGMASIVLYESWLAGRPTLSLQPGLVRDDLVSIASRPGIVSVRSSDRINDGVGQWLTQSGGPAREDLARHADAAERIAKLLVAEN